MSYHLYCALWGPESPVPHLPPGVGGQAVSLVCRGRLGVAVSRLEEASLALDLRGIRAHERVVACLHRHRTVIPMRYGCRLADESQVSQLLWERGPHYQALLTQLDGCVEMGIRLLAPAEPVRPPDPEVPRGFGDEVHPESPGLAYLKTRQAHYRRLEGLNSEQGRLARELEAIFSGLFSQVKVEGPRRLPLLSLYFLVPRRSLVAFRRRFRGFSRQAPAKLLLSGPWPPYNFVTDEGNTGWPADLPGQTPGFL